MAPGRLIAGRYRLETVIGRGGMGIVWQARDESLDRDVAIKELSWPDSFSAAEREAARRGSVREARAAARLSHRNVIRIFDILEEDGCPWIVMELLSPRSLRDLVREEGPLEPARAAAMGLEVLDALRAAHALGIVHRDVKPANILMASDRAVLADFGIARAIDRDTDATTVSMLIGSPAYIAPERARGGPSGPPADLWGLGATLYAAVEGSGPFERDGGPLASLTAVVADEPEPALHAGPLLWPVISGLLRKDPDARLDAATAERMLRRATVPAPPARRIAGWRRGKKPAAALIGSAVLAVAALAGTTAALDHPGHAQQGAAATPPAAAPAAAGPGTRSGGAPAAGTTGRQPGSDPAPASSPGTHLAARTRSAPAQPETSPDPAGGPAQPVGAAPPGGAPSDGPGNPGKPGKATPPGHDNPPAGPGNGKGNGKGKGNDKP